MGAAKTGISAFPVNSLPGTPGGKIIPGKKLRN